MATRLEHLTDVVMIHMANTRQWYDIVQRLVRRHAEDETEVPLAIDLEDAVHIIITINGGRGDVYQFRADLIEAALVAVDWKSWARYELKEYRLQNPKRHH